jgi:lipopolysaccharide transport system ATP-binding protein
MEEYHNIEKRVALELVDVTLRYVDKTKVVKNRKKTILRNISLTINQGETFGIIGQNGAGKSSLLNILAGSFEPNSGIVKRHYRASSLLTLNSGFDPALTGRENAIFGCLLYGKPLKNAKKLIGSIHEYSGLGEKFDDKVLTYSTGMRARLGFSVAVHCDLYFILLD